MHTSCKFQTKFPWNVCHIVGAIMPLIYVAGKIALVIRPVLDYIHNYILNYTQIYTEYYP